MMQQAPPERHRVAELRAEAERLADAIAGVEAEFPVAEQALAQARRVYEATGEAWRRAFVALQPGIAVEHWDPHDFSPRLAQQHPELEDARKEAEGAMTLAGKELEPALSRYNTLAYRRGELAARAEYVAGQLQLAEAQAARAVPQETEPSGRSLLERIRAGLGRLETKA